MGLEISAIHGSAKLNLTTTPRRYMLYVFIDYTWSNEREFGYKRKIPENFQQKN